MYKIIGADGRQYGPVTLDQVRQWIAQGRANAQTQVQPEGSSEWSPLGSLPEFADVLGGEAPPTAPFSAAGAPGTGGRDAALDAVRAPAIALKIVAGLMVLLMALVLVAGVLVGVSKSNPFSLGDPNLDRMVASASALLQIVIGIVIGAMAVVVFAGASRMQALRSYPLAVVSAILSMAPCGLCCLGVPAGMCSIFTLPVGIWALIVLSRPDVRGHFS